jgi:hypothetical protein
MSTNVVYTTVQPGRFAEDRKETRWWGTARTPLTVNLANTKKLVDAILTDKVLDDPDSDVFLLSKDNRSFQYGHAEWHEELEFLVFPGSGGHTASTTQVYNGVFITITVADVIRVREQVLGEQKTKAVRERIARAQAELEAAQEELRNL